MDAKELRTILELVETAGIKPFCCVSGENMTITSKNQNQIESFHDLDVNQIPKGVKFALGKIKEFNRVYNCCVFYKSEEKPEIVGVEYIIPFHEYKDIDGEDYLIRLELDDAQKYYNTKLELISVVDEIKPKW